MNIDTTLSYQKISPKEYSLTYKKGRKHRYFSISDLCFYLMAY